MEKEKLNNQVKPSNYSFTMVPDYFFRKLIKVMGAMPSLVYLALLSYCHKEKYIAWPSLNTMSQEMGMAKTTIIRNLNILIKLNFIKNITKDKYCKNYYQHNVYQILPPEKILLSFFSDAKNNAGGGSVTLPLEFQNATDSGSETIPWVVAKRYPNNNNINNNNITTKRKKDAVVAVNFKKLKEKGEEKVLAIKEQLLDLDFEGKFIEELLKDYPPKKIEEKIDLLMERKNIKNPAGWLSAALKNDYQDVEQERYDEKPLEQVSRQTPPSHLNSTPSMGKKFRETIVIDSHLSPEDRKIQSRERVLKMIRKTRKMLENLKTKGGNLCQN
ncbi:hypothetical protein ES702_04178 [subsurface metagenome]